ncbi:cell division protein MraZ [Methylacidiphilum kamchatkense Kam1]|jgi:MraZ protein|uniref:Transcriptional regulator MraZ n=1 Tax=Methylacidiphilum kamchatkense Kam1 TaxID=1202785 RepID=A0A0C1RWQ3_9BACT|nr:MULTISPECIES: cell division protein MraZ [Methylacidiphilum (ex Ratnadevi et al. 2023)]KIE59366.1 cell division protein MraZ [Methylacidiphilum kamchatkense Kam1]QDQ42658.1 division/cell wall cluster transcriptional repressor MraZ [Methylacidiphilum kamchatkense Kam1]TFE65762.1 cell division protein MraZ [Methylacidiphilum sp. Yel]
MGKKRATYTDIFEHAFDEKGRITVPSEWRQEGYDSRLFVFPSKFHHLKVYPESWMEEIHQKIETLRLQDPIRQQLELLAQISQAVSWDQQGRISIKERLRKHSQIGKEAVLVGRLDHFEIWDQKKWQEETAGKSTSFEEAIEGMGL